MEDKRLIIIQDDELPPTFSFADEDKMFTLATIPSQDITTDIKNVFVLLTAKTESASY